MKRLSRANSSARRLAAVAVAALVAFAPLGRAALAHNAPTHQQMTEFSYEALKAVEMVLANEFPQGMEVDERVKLLTEIRTPPAGVAPAEWEAFLRVLAEGARRLRTLRADLPAPKSPACGADIGVEQFCADPVPLDRKHPAAGWSAGTAGDVQFPVVQSYRTGSDCGVWNDWSPPKRFAGLNSCFLPGGLGRRAHRDHTGTLLGPGHTPLPDSAGQRRPPRHAHTRRRRLAEVPRRPHPA